MSDVLPKFPVRPYRPIRRANPLGLLLLAGALAGVSVVLGFVVYFIRQYFYIVLLFPMLIGFLIARAGMKIVYYFRLNSPIITGAMGFFAGVLTLLMVQYFGFRSLRSDVAGWSPEFRAVIDDWSMLTPEQRKERAFGRDISNIEAGIEEDRIRNVFDYMDFRAKKGISLKKSGIGETGTSLSLGYVGTYIYWGLEAIIVAVIAAFFTRISAGGTYCASCGQEKRSRRLGSFSGNIALAAEGIREGDLEKMRAAKPQSQAGAAHLDVSYCEKCSDNTLDVSIWSLSPKEKITSIIQTHAQMTFPREALPFLEGLFSTPSPSEDAPAD